MPTLEELDTKARADQLLRTGKHAEALALYRSLMARFSAFEPGVYESWLDGAMAAFRVLGARREVGHLQLALRRFAEAQASLSPTLDPVAWSLSVSRQGHPKRAAAQMESAGFLVLAARELEAAEDDVGALQLWERIARSPPLWGRPYETVLVNLMRARLELRLGYTDASTKHNNEAVAQLEALACDFETRGQRERAFDCYLLLLRIELVKHAAFENIAEGYLNAIRILIADGQCDFALQYFDDFIAAAAERSEFHAAANVAMDAALYCRRSGLRFEQNFLRRSVKMWIKAATYATTQFNSPQLAENALCSALDAATSTRDFSLLASVYEELARLPVANDRSAQYRDLWQKYAHSTNTASNHESESVWPLSSIVGNAYQDIAWQDLIEWELAGNVESTLSLIVVERTDHLRSSRAALFALLLAVGSPHWRTNATQSCSVAKGLGDVEVYEVLAPLELLAMNDSDDVRSAAMAAVGRVLCKRSFATIRKGLQDGNEQVMTSARQALKGLHFRDGLDCLSRIFRESIDPAVRAAALHAIANVATLSAADILLDVIVNKDEALQQFAVERLSSLPVSGLVPHVRARFESASPSARQVLSLLMASIESRSAY